MNKKQRAVNLSTPTNCLLALIGWVILNLLIAAQPVQAANEPSPQLSALDEITPESLYEMAQMGRGDKALAIITQLALELGGWGPADGDVVVYDPDMRDDIRGAVINYDEIPAECSSKPYGVQYSFDPETCIDIFLTLETEIRFGEYLFADPAPTGELVPRRNLYDILATFIEEVGHSWQEYFFETDGRGRGERLHPTTLVDAQYWAHGQEYQIKMYILNLDGEILHLSDWQHQRLLEQICFGYANPIGAEVPPYLAPFGWPNPEGWPIDNPPQGFLADLCKPVT